MNKQIMEKIGDTYNGKPITPDQKKEYNNLVELNNLLIKMNATLDKLFE